MQSDGTAIWSHALVILTLQRKQCTGGLSRTIKQRAITLCWAKLPRNFKPPIRPVCGRAKQFYGCIRNEAKETCHGIVALDQSRESLTPISLLTIDRTAPGSRARGKS